MLLTELEAAAYMGWSREKIRRFRLSGRLPYYPGNPPKIDSADLDELKIPPPPPPPPPPPTQQEILAKAAARARLKWLQYQFKSKRRT
jgi:hypothetical protein